MQNQKQINQNKLQRLKISSLKFDEDNPNFMTEEQMNVLRDSFKKYGNLHPITVDQNNMIADGEHRVKVYKENGEKFIEGYKIKLTDNDRRMLRQIMNKNRGQHQPEKDYSELIQLIANKDNVNMLELMGINKSSLSDLQDLIQANSQSTIEEVNKARLQDGNPAQHHANSFLYGNIKQITTYFDNQTYEEAIKMSKELMELLGIGNHTDLFWTILNYVYENKDSINLNKLHVTPPPRQEMQLTYE